MSDCILMVQNTTFPLTLLGQHEHLQRLVAVPGASYAHAVAVLEDPSVTREAERTSLPCLAKALKADLSEWRPGKRHALGVIMCGRSLPHEGETSSALLVTRQTRWEPTEPPVRACHRRHQVFWPATSVISKGEAL
jgi:hypothetical protein